jgi:2-aminomuconate deaminase
MDSSLLGVHYSQQAPKAVGPYPHVRRVGPFLFLSGIGPRARGQTHIPGVELHATTKEILSYNFEVQCRQVFHNVNILLEECGSHLHSLVDITVFLTNMKEDFPLYNRLYEEFVGSSPTPPARTTVEVTALPTPIAIELKCLAMIGSYSFEQQQYSNHQQKLTQW